MKFCPPVGRGSTAIAVAALFACCGCGGESSRLVLIGSGNLVRITPADNGSCPSGWNQGDFDDRDWDLAHLPIQSTAGACVRARFDPGSQLGRYRWLEIDLSAPSQASLTSAKPLGARQGLGSINWTTQDGQTAQARDNHNSYRLDLMLFPDLLQAQRNVLALQIAASPRLVSVSAELDVDDAAADPFVHAVKGPYLVRPTAGASRVLWETSSSAPSWVMVDDQQYDGGWAVHHDVAVSGLAPGTVHPVYVASAEASALPPDCAAMVVPPMMHLTRAAGVPDEFGQYILRRDLCQQLEAAIRSRPSLLRSVGGDAVRLVVLGDTRTDPRARDAVMAAAATEAPDLLLHTGDLVADAVEPDWQAWFDRAQPLWSQAPIAAVPGERDTAFGPDRFGQLFGVVGTGEAGHVYSVDQGTVHVAVLDSNADLIAGAVWLDQDLTRATAAGAKHLFVALHWGPWSSGPEGGNGDAVAAVVPVARRHHVDAILSGHDAIYEHGVVSGLHYFVSGGAGATVDAPSPLASTVTASSKPHYLVVNVTGAAVRVQAKDAAGTVLDDVLLQKP